MNVAIVRAQLSSCGRWYWNSAW